MTPRPELIMQAIKAKLTGLSVTGQHIYRGRAYPIHNDELPCVCLYMGDDRVVTFGQTGVIDWDLSVFVECYAMSSLTQVDTIAANIRRDVHEAIVLDPTLGLDFVMDTVPVIALQPEISDDGNKPVIMMKLEFNVKYRTSRGRIDA